MNAWRIPGSGQLRDSQSNETKTKIVYYRFRSTEISRPDDRRNEMLSTKSMPKKHEGARLGIGEILAAVPRRDGH